MSDAGGEEVSKRLMEKKNKYKTFEKEKKRKRSDSVDSRDYEREKKIKTKSKKYDIETDDTSLNKSRTYKEKENKVKNSKSRPKSKTLGSDSENKINNYDSDKTKSWHSKRSKNRRSASKEESLKDYSSKTRSLAKHKNKSEKVEYNDEKHSRHKSRHSGSENDERDQSSSSKKLKKQSTKERNKKYSSNNKLAETPNIGDEKGDFDEFSNREGDELEHVDKGKSRYSEKERRYRKSSRKKHDSKYYDRDDPLENGDDDDKANSGSDRPVRYWSTDQGPVRKNSDSYWNKYSERLIDSTDRTERVEVGPRYYSPTEKNEKKIADGSKLKDKKDEAEELKEKDISGSVDKPPPVQKKSVDLLTSRTGGAYIPPAKLRMMQESITDKASAAYQRLAWEALKKSIQGHVNKVNISNIKIILKAIMKENIVRGRGLLCRALIQAQAASPTFTNVYASFVAVLNAKFPKLGELLLKRLVVQFRRGFKRNDKTICITAATFIAHLVNQEVAHEIIALEMLTLLIETPTDDSVEVAIAFLKECGMKLTEVSSKGVMAIFDMLRNILHEGRLEQRVQYMIEVMFQVRKEDFKAHPALTDELDLVEDDDKIQHMITIEDNHDPEDILNVFKFDPNYEENEAKYKSVAGVDSDDESGDEGDSSGSDASNEDSEAESVEGERGEVSKGGVIVDRTETNLVALRKTIYLTIQSSLDFEECAHKLLRMELKPGQEVEMAHMFLDCCAEQRTYEKFYGLLSQRFCQINRAYVGPFEETFRDSYETIHRLSNDKLRNVAKLFAHLLYTDAISWEVLSSIRLNEDDTTSSSRIFIKILFLELSEYMGLAKLNQRVKDPSLQLALEGLFPRDNPKHTRFAINFFTSIGLGGLTDELREHLKTQPKPSVVPQLVEGLSSSSSDSSSDSSDSSDSSSESSSSDSSSSESEDNSKKKKKSRLSKKQPQKNEKSVSPKKRQTSPTKRKRDR